MAYLDWSEDLNTGIPVIDRQHQRIVVYINKLHGVCRDGGEADVREVISELIDYAFSHFAFEESMIQEAGYEQHEAHTATHNDFRNQIYGFKQRSSAGEEVADELLKLLKKWLFGHIHQEDMKYVEIVMRHFDGLEKPYQETWFRRQVKRVFG